MLPTNCLNQCFHLLFEPEQKVSAVSHFHWKQWFIRTKIIVKKDRDGTVLDMVLVALLCAVQAPYLWSYLNREAVNNSNWHSVTKHCISRSLFGEDPTRPESSWEPCQVSFQYKCIIHGPVKCGNCFDRASDTQVNLWKSHFLFLIGAYVHEWIYNQKFDCNAYICVAWGERHKKEVTNNFPNFWFWIANTVQTSYMGETQSNLQNVSRARQAKKNLLK